jgi:uncharacterized membrane protein HdeD (DUF308 family)
MAHQAPHPASGFGRGFTTPADAMQRWLAVLDVAHVDLVRARRWLVGVGVLALLGGAVSIAVPIITSVAVTLFIGWLLIYHGVLTGVHAVSRFSERRPLNMLNALVTLAAGLVLVIFPLTGTITLTVVLAAWFFASGVLHLAIAFERRGMAGAGLEAFHGVVDVALGVLIAVSLPSSAAWAIGLLVGISLVFWGTRALMAAWILRRVDPGSATRPATGAGPAPA